MIIDSLAQFSNAQAVTASAASSSIIDGGIAKNLGVGYQGLFLVIALVADMTDAGSDSTVTATLRTSATAASGALTGSPTTLLTDAVFAALSKKGTMHILPLPPGNYLEFLDVYYTVANGNLTTGKFTAFITDTVDLQAFYAVGYSIS